MWQLLQNFAHWLQNTPYALYFATSDWAFPPVQAVHFTGLSLWVGTSAAIDFRLIGIGNKQTPYELSKALIIWNWIGLGIAILGGFTFFSIAAGTYIVNPAFMTKVGLFIPSGVMFHIYILMKIGEWSKAPEIPPIAKILGWLELTIWFSVVAAAVAIPFF
jgi:hypothetical protein